MKTKLLFFALLISGVVIGQEIEDSTSLRKYAISNHLFDSVRATWPTINPYRSSNLKIGFGLTQPTHMIEIKAGDKRLNFDFKGDSLIVTGDAKLDESAKIFIDFCRKYMRTKIDSLETELQKYKDLFLNQKVDYIPSMGNSSIYDTIPGAGYIRVSDANGNPVWKKPIVKPDIFKLLLDYEKQCLSDTIKAENFEGAYLIEHKFYKQITSERQLAEWGYRYTGRWYKGLDAKNGFVFDNYFVREPTISGFLQWYKTKIK